MAIIRSVILEGVNRKKDKSVSIRFTTSLEQSPEELMEIDKVLDSHGILYFSDRDTLTQREIDEIEKVDIEIEGKTKSQRLRNVLHVYNSQNSNIDFKEFYAKEMERIISHYKDKLIDA